MLPWQVNRCAEKDFLKFDCLLNIINVLDSVNLTMLLNFFLAEICFKIHIFHYFVVNAWFPW